jgi:rhodanese-related sulfurtransferase
MGAFALSGLVLIAGLFAAGWSWPWHSGPKPAWPDIRRQIAEHYPQVVAVTTEELARWLDAPDPGQDRPVLLDVRTRAEYDVSHLPGAVWAETAAQQQAALADQPANRPVVVYCSVGWRSAQAADRLNAKGGRTVFNLDGSIFQWANENRPVVGPDGKPTQRVHPYNRSWGSLLDRRRWAFDPGA